MSTYFAILTQVGEAKLANAIALGTTLALTQMGVGDGNGNLPVPSRTQTALINEVRRAAINMLAGDPANTSQVIVEQVLPENVGGWWIREIGIYDAAGDLCAVANCPPSYKPQLVEGSGRTQVVRVVLIVASTTAIELKIDPSVVLATRAYVDQYAARIDHTHDAAAIVSGILSTARIPALLIAHTTDLHAALDSKAALRSPAFTDVPTAPTPPAGDRSQNLANTEFVQQSIGTGQVTFFASNSAPIGYLKANGATISRNTYAALFTAIGTLFGVGDDITTFKLPDLRGEFIRGFDEGRGIDTSRLFGTPQSATTTQGQLYGNNGGGSGNQWWADIDNGSGWDNGGAIQVISTGQFGRLAIADMGISTSLSRNYGAVRPSNVALLACIKY